MASSWYLMELVATDPVSYRCLKAHFKSRQKAIAAMNDLYNVRSRIGNPVQQLEVWDDPSYSRWYWNRASGFGEGWYG